MNLIKVLLLGISISAMGCRSHSMYTSQVKVLDKNLNVLSTIEDKNTLIEFGKLWTERIKISPSELLSFDYTIDISANFDSGRWLYNPNGFAVLLTYKLSPIYQFQNPEILRKILIPQ